MGGVLRRCVLTGESLQRSLLVVLHLYVVSPPLWFLYLYQLVVVNVVVLVLFLTIRKVVQI